MQYTHPNSNFNGQLDLGLPDFQTNPNVELVLGRRRVDGRQRKQAMSDPFFWDGVGWDVNAHIYIYIILYIYAHILDATLPDLLWHLHTHLTKEKAQWPK